MSQKNPWTSRWNVFKALIDEKIDELDDSDNPKKSVLTSLLTDLRDFASHQFDYFHHRLRSKQNAPDGYSHEYALSSTLDQVGFDISLITLCAEQRAADQDIQRTLDMADYLVNAALQPAINAGFFEHRPVGFTYLYKSPRIRVMPYSNVALVGIPITCLEFPDTGAMQVTRDLLAIPHEVGHFVYWKAELPEEKTDNETVDEFSGYLMRHAVHRLANRLTKSQKWLYDWREEVFADVYGCRIAGPLIAADFQDLQIENTDFDEFFAEDGDHPAPVIRPEGYLATMRTMSNTSNWPDVLARRWQDKRKGKVDRENGGVEPRRIRLKDRRIETKYTATSGKNRSTDTVSVVEAGDGLTRVACKINDLLQGIESAPEFWEESVARRNIKPDPSRQLYAEFENRLEDVKTNKFPNRKHNDPLERHVWSKPSVWNHWKDELIGYQDEAYPIRRTKSLQRNPEALSRIQSDREWHFVLHADGWTEEITGPPKGGG